MRKLLIYVAGVSAIIALFVRFETPPVTAAPPTSVPPAAASASVAVVDAAGLKKQVAARKGKVVVLNLWATWCGPCVEEFPGLVSLQNKHRAKGLELVTLSLDDPDDKTKVNAFLAKHKQTRGTFLQKGEDGGDIEAFIKWLEPKAGGDSAVAIPRTYIFDRSGKLVKTLVGGHTMSAFEKAIAPYLKK